MASELYIRLNTDAVAIELVDSGSDFADLLNEVADAARESGHVLSEHELALFRLNLNEGGRVLLRQLSGHAKLLAAAKEVMSALAEYGPSIVPHLMDSDQNAGQRLRVAIAEA